MLTYLQKTYGEVSNKGSVDLKNRLGEAYNTTTIMY